MKTYLITLAITFAIILFVALLINFCRRRMRNSRHGLTGMCHKDGGAACASCTEDQAKKKLT